MARVLCVANQKGGVGKTTTAINLAVGLAKSGAHTLLVDLDPQCNATSGLGAKPLNRHPLVRNTPLVEAIVPTATPGLELLAGCRNFEDIEALAHGDPAHATQLRQQLVNGAAGYDYVLLDCPPSLGKLTRTALAASTEVIMPIQCEYYAMEGLAQMIQVVRDVIQAYPNRLAFGGIILTMYDHTLELTREVDEEVREFFGEIVFETVIPRDPWVCEAPSHGKSVLDHAPRSRGARAYAELCRELLEQN
ncbi:MAG: ParA family protein [Planctomycetia bacterium]|nr:ParA family protein [Planctomycetia bacterium]